MDVPSGKEYGKRRKGGRRGKGERGQRFYGLWLASGIVGLLQSVAGGEERIGLASYTQISCAGGGGGGKGLEGCGRALGLCEGGSIICP